MPNKIFYFSKRLQYIRALFFLQSTMVLLSDKKQHTKNSIQMKRFSPGFWLIAMSLTFDLIGQPLYTADDFVTPYDGQYRTGVNMGYFPNWDNYTLANIGAGNPVVNQKGIGARTLRFSATESILDFYGYNLLVPEVAHYASLNTADHTAIVWGPAGPHQDITQYCPGQPSALFSNMYLPIWDGGANGTPYNDDNYLAAYLYKTVSTYKNDIKFWEIWNEPGLDLRFDIGGIGWRDQSYPGNWWAEGPAPCDYILRAPVYHYIRTLRISWEIIKTVDPDAYVCLGSVGYQSLLNAICNNTDNPNMGDVTAEFPKKGGAYFDGITFHSYPHFDGATTNYSQNFFQRHSDQAADGVITYRQLYQTILDQYGYNGVSKPRKEWVITEINSPRKVFGLAFPGSPQLGAFFGGNDAQINHIMKALMISKVSGIRQTHIYELFDRKSDADAGYEFDLMGLYKVNNGAIPYNITVNDEGIATKTTSDFLHNTTYDPLKTASLALPSSLRGYAFKRTDGSYIYAIWARTTQDLSENASGTFSFPASFNLQNVEKYDWSYGYTGTSSLVSSQGINLTARPTFFTAPGTIQPCAIAGVATNVTCNDNNTPSLSTDDTYTFTLTVNNGSTGTWTGFINGTPISGAYGTATTFGPYPVASGNITFTVRDAVSTTCATEVVVVAPPTCSNVVNCAMTANVTNLQCSDNGTPSNPDDDTYTFSVAVNQTGVCGTGWYGGNTFGNYGTTTNFGPFPIGGTPTYIGFQDNINLTIGTSVTVPSPAPCSAVTPTCVSLGNIPYKEWITAVQVSNMSNTSGKSNYTDYSASKTANIVAGMPTAFALTAGYSFFPFDQYWRVWVDYNNDNLFTQNEQLYEGVLVRPTNGTATKTLNFTAIIPATVSLGNTKMRISMSRSGFPQPCAPFTYGEVEDYGVNITPMIALRNNLNSTELESQLVSVYPNPSQGKTYLDLTDWLTYAEQNGDVQESVAHVYLYNQIGDLVHTQEYQTANSKVLELDLSNLPKGVYHARIETAGHLPATKKIQVIGN
jgi:hypothetical protein